VLDVAAEDSGLSLPELGKLLDPATLIAGGIHGGGGGGG
jgi:fumarate hydratase class II